MAWWPGGARDVAAASHQPRVALSVEEPASGDCVVVLAVPWHCGHPRACGNGHSCLVCWRLPLRGNSSVCGHPRPCLATCPLCILVGCRAEPELPEAEPDLGHILHPAWPVVPTWLCHHPCSAGIGESSSDTSRRFRSPWRDPLHSTPPSLVLTGSVALAQWCFFCGCPCSRAKSLCRTLFYSGK